MKRIKFILILLFISCSAFLCADIRDTAEFTIEAIIPGESEVFSELVVRNLYTGSSVMDSDSVYGGQVVVNDQNINLGRGSHLLNDYIPMFVVDYTTNKYGNVSISVDITPFVFEVDNTTYYYILPGSVKAEAAVNYSNSSVSENVTAGISPVEEDIQFTSKDGVAKEYDINLSANENYQMSAGELVSFDITYSVKLDGVTYDELKSNPDPSITPDNGFVAGKYVMNVTITLNGE